MLAAYVGYKLFGVGGAAVAAAASFLPSFVLMLAILPAFDRIRSLGWAKAVMQGIVPGVIGVMGVALVRLAPHAAPDPFAAAVLVATVAALMLWRLAPLKAMATGALVGIFRTHLSAVGWGR
jgi:chromate transporter